MTSMVCANCGGAFSADDIFDHLWDAHGIHEEWERWEDGGLVIIDTTLEPHQFDPPKGTGPQTEI